MKNVLHNTMIKKQCAIFGLIGILSLSCAFSSIAYPTYAAKEDTEKLDKDDEEVLDDKEALDDGENNNEDDDDGEFDGWDDDGKENAWQVYQFTDWAEVADKLIISVEHITNATDKVEAKDISPAVALYKTSISTVLSNSDKSYGYIDNTKWTDLMLAALQAMSAAGLVNADDPYQVMKYNIGNYADNNESIDANTSIKVFYETFIDVLTAHQDAGGNFEFYSNNKETRSVLQGVLLGAVYTQQNPEYTKENAKAYYDTYPGSFTNKGIPAYHSFAAKVSKHYKVTTFTADSTGSAPGQKADQASIDGILKSKASQSRKDLVKRAMSYVGERYVYGGSWNGEDPYTPTDCSGFVKGLWKHAGVDPGGRSTDQIWAWAQQNGLDYHDFKDAQPGDLVMYDGHVAMLTGNGKQIVHASNKTDGVKLSSKYDYRAILGFIRYPAKDDNETKNSDKADGKSNKK